MARITRIDIPHGFRGVVSGERWIPPGEYDADDERVAGIVQHLVQTGHANVLEIDTGEPEPVDYDRWTKAELATEVAQRGITLAHGSGADGALLKDDYIEALLAHDDGTDAAAISAAYATDSD